MPKPTVPLCTVLWSVGSRLPPTPTQRLAPVTVRRIDCAAVTVTEPPVPVTVCDVRLNVPLAATKPSAISTPSVPSTLMSVEPERLKPRPVTVDQSSGTGAVPPVALFTLTSRFVT